MPHAGSLPFEVTEVRILPGCNEYPRHTNEAPRKKTYKSSDSSLPEIPMTYKIALNKNNLSCKPSFQIGHMPN